MYGKQLTALDIKSNGRIRITLGKKLIKQRYLTFMLLPAVIATLVFCYIPIAGWYLAFVDYHVGQNILSSKWAGLKNFLDFFGEGSDYLYIIRNTLVMNISSIVINLFTAMLFAILLKELVSAKFSKSVQVVSFFPFFISWVTTYSFIYALFGSASGAINQTLVNLGVIKEGIDFLGGSEYAWGLIILMNLWKYLGYNSIIFLASIAAIPLEQYEAANIDGAGRFQKLCYITVPNLIPTVVVLLIMNSGWILNSNFEQFYLFTNSANLEKMDVFDMYIYRFGLKLANYSYATAVGIVRTVVSIAILLLVNRFAKKMSASSIL